MYENSEADGNIDKAAVSVLPDGAQRVVSPPSRAHVSFGHRWNEQIAESEPFIWAAGGGDSGRAKEAVKDLWPNEHLLARQLGARRDSSLCRHRIPKKRGFRKRNRSRDVQFNETSGKLNRLVWNLVPPWWCDKLPPLARISSLAACWGEKKKSKLFSGICPRSVRSITLNLPPLLHTRAQDRWVLCSWRQSKSRCRHQHHTSESPCTNQKWVQTSSKSSRMRPFEPLTCLKLNSCVLSRSYNLHTINPFIPLLFADGEQSEGGRFDFPPVWSPWPQFYSETVTLILLSAGIK